MGSNCNFIPTFDSCILRESVESYYEMTEFTRIGATSHE